jgi:tetratricopeptide (TPR) repeat protein
LDNPLIESPTASRIFVALALLGKYGAMSFWPWPLSSDYSFAEISGNPDPNILAYLVSVFALGVLLVDGIIKKKPTWLWPSWFFVSFLITSNVVFLTGTAFAERLVYLGSAAACVLLAMTIQGLRSKAISLAASLSIIFVFAVASWSYSLNWHSNHTLANYELVQSPKSARVQYNYGISLFTQGYSQQSEEYFEKALEIYPQYAEAAYALAQALMRRWDKKGAEKLYLGVLKLSPNHYGAILGLYGITAGQNRSKEAKAYRDRLMAIDPHNPRLQRLEHALKLAAR